MVIAKPQHTADVLRKHEAKVSLRDNNFQRIKDARIAKEVVLITASQTNTDLTITLAELQNDIVPEELININIILINNPIGLPRSVDCHT